MHHWLCFFRKQSQICQIIPEFDTLAAWSWFPGALSREKKGKSMFFFWSTPSRPWKLKSSWSIGITVTLWCNIHLMNPRSHYKSIQLIFFGLIFWWNPNMFVYAEEFGMKPWQSSKILNLDITFASAIARISKKMLRSLGSLYLQNTNLSNPYK